MFTYVIRKLDVPFLRMLKGRTELLFSLETAILIPHRKIMLFILQLLKKKAGKTKNENISLEYLKNEQTEHFFNYTNDYEKEDEDYLIDGMEEN